MQSWRAGDGSTNHLEQSVPLPGELELKDGVFEVGREEPADIVIPVPTVSGRHALLRISATRCTLDSPVDKHNTACR
jgi:hypothetical protein